MPAAAKPAPARPIPRASTTPLLNIGLIAGSLAYGVWLLVQGDRLTWPPGPLLASLYTVAGCLGLVGPIVLASASRDRGGSGLGELIWMTGGLLIWAFDLAAAARGDWGRSSWATPLDYRSMGLTTLAVGLAGWRLGGSGVSWSWTNVVGWGLGLFWVGMGLATLWPEGVPLR